MYMQKASGVYAAPDKTEVGFSYEYMVFEGTTAQDLVNDAVAVLGVQEVAKRLQSEIKTNAGNTAREKAKSDNGHSTRKPMTEAEKAEAKVKRQEKDTVYNILKDRGLSIADLEALLK